MKLAQCVAKRYFEVAHLNQPPWYFQANFSEKQINLSILFYSILSITFLGKFGLTQSVFKSIEWNL